jgi:hypothetical protein
MSRRSAPEPPRPAEATDEPASRVLPLVGLPLVLALIGLIGFAIQLATPDPAHTASDLGVQTTTARGNGPAGVNRPSEVRFVPGHELSKKLPIIPRSYVRVPTKLAFGTTFNVVSFNALGYSHTARGGDRKGWAPGTARMRAMVGIIHAQDASVVGFQEFQGPQYAVFHAMAPEYDIYPGTTLGSQPLQNSIAWRTSDWTLVRSQMTPIPYFFNRVPMPQVLLKNVHTGRLVWFGNFHNPADKFHPAQGARVAATAIEATMANNFLDDGYPVIYTGDMNERDSFFCRLSTLAPFAGADGAHRDATGCHTVSPTPVDWIVGTRPITFSNYLRDTSTESRRLSDHFLIRATATLPAERSLKRCIPAPQDRAAVYCPPRKKH